MNYAGGRSNGCTSWSPSDAEQIIPLMKEPTTLYIYPESTDIEAIAQAVKAGRSPSRAGLYWNASCLKEIGVAEILAERNAGADPRQIEKGSTVNAAAASADLQGAVTLSLFRQGLQFHLQDQIASAHS